MKNLLIVLVNFGTGYRSCEKRFQRRNVRSELTCPEGLQQWLEQRGAILNIDLLILNCVQQNPYNELPLCVM